MLHTRCRPWCAERMTRTCFAKTGEMLFTSSRYGGCDSSLGSYRMMSISAKAAQPCGWV